MRAVDPEAPEGYGPEDYFQAQWLAYQCFKRSVRFDHGHTRWHIFKDPGIWFPDEVRDVPYRVKQWAEEAAFAAQRQGTKNGQYLEKDIKKLLGVVGADRALVALSEMPDYRTDGSDWDQTANLLGCANGILDLTTGELRMGQPEDLVTRSTGVKWNDNAECPKFWQFLLQITADVDGNERPDLAQYLVLVFGAAMFGHTKTQQFWVLSGRGGAGKGTLARIIEKVLGDRYAKWAGSTLYAAQRFGDASSDKPRADLIDLQGRRAIFISEPSGAFNDELLKQHSGEDPINARSLHSNRMVSWRPTHTIFFLSNNPPAVKDVGVSMSRRVRVVPFDQSFQGDEVVPGLDDLIVSAEAPGILRLLAEGARLYADDPKVLDLSRAPKSVQEASAAYIEDNDPLREFVTTQCVAGPGKRASATTLYNAYKHWHEAKGDGEPVMSAMAFGTTLGPDYLKKKVHGVNVYHGIDLRPVEDRGLGD